MIDHVNVLRSALRVERDRNAVLENMIEDADSQAAENRRRFEEASDECRRLRKALHASNDECKRRGELLLELTADMVRRSIDGK